MLHVSAKADDSHVKEESPNCDANTTPASISHFLVLPSLFPYTVECNWSKELKKKNPPFALNLKPRDNAGCQVLVTV